MPDERRALKVFLCHASADKPKVRELYRYLKKRGIQPWLDAEDLVPGQNWRVEIPKALNSSDAIIVCLTKNSVDKEGYIQREIKFALDKALEMPEGRIFLIPARLEDCEVPYSLNDYQWVDLFEEGGNSRMLRALKMRASQLQRANVEVISESMPVGPELREIPASPVREPEPQKQFVEVQKERAPTPQAAEVRTQEVKKARPKLNTLIIVAVIGLTGTIVAILLGSSLIEKWFSPAPVSTAMETATNFVAQNTNAQVSSAATTAFTATQPISSTSASTEIRIPTSILAPWPTGIIDAKGAEMMLVPAGEFSMGSESGYENEKPIHAVNVAEFYIDKYEVTNALYKACVDAGVCEPPKDLGHYSNSRYSNHPVVFVDWYMANVYCAWRGARLPTEAEWEKAARGTDRRIYAWGNNFDETRANVFLSGLSDTNAVGMYENGKSPFGVYDLTGNVGEWTSSLYQSYPYNPKDGREDQVSTDDRVIRGGSFGNSDIDTRTTSRFPFKPSKFSRGDGFRCAKDVNP